MKYFILSLSIFLLYSCSKQEQVTDTKKIIFNEEANPDFFNTLTCKFIPLETNDSCLFNDIKEIQIVDNKIYIIDNKRSKLLVFDISGKFITQIGNLGNGPGEYLAPSNFNIDKEKQTITIADVGQSKLLYYDLNNYQYINSQKMRLNSVKIKHPPILCAIYTKIELYFCEPGNKMYIDCWPRIW